MRTFAIGVVLVCVGIFVPFDSSSASENNWFMAFCDDGDGPLSGWVSSRDEAFIAGRDHERAARNHKWEVLVQAGAANVRPPACALLSDGEKPETVKLQNLCGGCRSFMVSRTMADGSMKSKPFSVKANSKRYFRKIDGAVISVAVEADCPK